jgi:predicted nucleic acid-binding protein
MIASICIANNLILVSDDNDFQNIDWLKVENWTK